MRKIIRLNETKPRISLDSFFEPLNEWGYNFFIKSSVDEAVTSGQMDPDCKEALKMWNETECKSSSCVSCLFDKPQEWIEQMDFNGISSLCDLLESIISKKPMKKRKHLDFMDVAWAKYSGNYGSNQ